MGIKYFIDKDGITFTKGKGKLTAPFSKKKKKKKKDDE
tara:strand:- start:524 stop:637 length:114 start_codon:yes stop_codon:yes gene_type:complete